MNGSVFTLELIVGLVCLVWLMTLSVLLLRTVSHFRRLTKGSKKKDLMSLLDKILDNIGVGGKERVGIVKRVAKIEKDNVYFMQKVGLVRFNPFSETGGNQSFSLAILDNNGSGLVISSLHSRDVTRVYAKPIQKGKADGFELSDEEKRAIKKARRLK